MSLSRKRDGLLVAIPLLSAVALRLLWLLTTYDYQADSFLRTINMMTLGYHPIWPPGYFYLAKPFYVLFGHPSLVMRLISFVAGIGSIGVLYSLVRAISRKKRPAFWVAFFIAILPIHVAYSVHAMAEMPFFFFWIASLYALVKRNILVSAGLLGLATMIRYEAWLFVGVIPLYLVAKALWANRQAKPQQAAPLQRPLKEATSFFAVSAFLPLLYMAINWLVFGAYLQPYFLEPILPAAPQEIVTPQHSPPSTFEGDLLDLFVHGMMVVPTPVESFLAQPRQTFALLPPELVPVLGLGLFLLLLGLALVGVAHAWKSSYRDFPLLVASLLLSLFFFVIFMESGTFRLRAQYTFWPLNLITLFAALGTAGLVARRRTRFLGYGLAAVVTVGFLLISLTLGYSGPPEVVEMAEHLEEMGGASTPRVRLRRVVGLTGPEEQSEMWRALLGPRASHLEPWISSTSDNPVVIVDGANEPYDTHQFYMIQALSDLSYNQLSRLSLKEFEEQEQLLDATPGVILLAKESLVQRGGEKLLSQLRAELVAHRYAPCFHQDSYEIWEMVP